MPLKSLINKQSQKTYCQSWILKVKTRICECKCAFIGQSYTYCFAISNLWTQRTLKCALTLITNRDRTQIEIETPREASICTFYSSISQQFISEITVNISFHKRTAGKDRTICVVLICFIVNIKGTNSGITQKKKKKK